MFSWPATVISPNCSYTGFLLDLSSSEMNGLTGTPGIRSACEMSRRPLAASSDVPLSEDDNATRNETSESKSADKRELSFWAIVICGICREIHWSKYSDADSICHIPTSVSIA
jgi:hypothetical protein